MAKILALLPALVLPLVALGCTQADVPTPTAALLPTSGSEGTVSAQGRPGSTAAVFVTSQGLYYHTFMARDLLPMHGPFQLLVNMTTEFGPGDHGYRGGRWWEDLNGNGVQDQGDHFFLAPLLPPGVPTLLP
jgi:hypothetical protein